MYMLNMLFMLPTYPLSNSPLMLWINTPPSSTKLTFCVMWQCPKLSNHIRLHLHKADLIYMSSLDEGHRGSHDWTLRCLKGPVPVVRGPDAIPPILNGGHGLHETTCRIVVGWYTGHNRVFVLRSALRLLVWLVFWMKCCALLGCPLRGVR